MKPKNPAHKAQLRESLLHGAARLGATKTQLHALLERDPLNAFARSVLAEIQHLEGSGQDPMPVIAEKGDQVRRDYMIRVVQPMAPVLDDARQLELNAAKATKYGADWAVTLAARAGHGGKGKSKTPKHAAQIIPNLLTEKEMRAQHGGDNAYKWLGRHKKLGSTRGEAWRTKMKAIHEERAKHLAPRYWEAQFRIRKDMTPTQLFALAKEFDPALTRPAFYELAGKAAPITTPTHLIARQLRTRRGRPPVPTVSTHDQERIRALSAAGQSARQISAATKIARTTVRRLLKP